MTKLIFYFLMALYSVEVSAQWTDDFSDGNYSSNSAWAGDTSKFIVNAASQLQLNAKEEAGTGYLSVSSNIAFKAAWSFKVRMEFNPSSGNYCRIYLMSDQADLTGSLNGYFLRIGYTNDDLCLFRQEGKTETLIVDGRDKIFNTALVKSHIKVTRSEHGKWALLCDTTGGENYSVSGSGVDSTFLKSRYLGLRCYYTSTRSKKFYFDDFVVSGELYSDGIRPKVDAFQVIDDTCVMLSFSEPVDSAFANFKENYLLENNQVSKIIWNNDTKRDVELVFSQKFFCEQNNQLFVRNNADEWNLRMKDTTFFFRYCTPQMNDIVFNEIMVDPTPVIGLPNAEYIELFNRSKKTFNLKGFKLLIGNYSFPFPEMNFPGESFLILSSKDNQPILSQFGNIIGMFTSSTALTNAEGNLQIKNQKGELMCQLIYSDSWYNDDFKFQGGWSLEQIDPWNPCGGKANWRASVSKNGGSPGTSNSVFTSNPDMASPEILRINVVSPTMVDVYFSEPIDSVIAVNNATYEGSPALGHPIVVVSLDKVYSVVRLTFGLPMVKDKIYTLTISKSIADCVGNKMTTEANITMGISSLPDSADIVINEVLFNAKAGGADYIELFNRSAKIFNTRNLLFGIKLDGATGNLCRLNDIGSMFYPNTYLLISSDIEKVKPFYSILSEKSLLEVVCLSSIDDKSSTIVLLNDTFGLVDEFSYSDKMHVATLKNTEGISLERINTAKPTWFPGNWHSAAETAGYGTPGYRNSQYVCDSVTTSAISITDEVFSPDNDGFKDILSVSYKFEKPDCRAQVIIFDSNGRLIRKLLNNLLLGSEGSFNWDGTDDTGRMCTVGLYVIFVRTVFNDGVVNEYKRTCVLATKR